WPAREPCKAVVTKRGADRFQGCYICAARPGAARRRRSAQQRVDERGGFERRQVVGPLTEPNQLDRYTELLLNAKNYAALGGTVQFREHGSGYLDHIGEHARLSQPVLPDGRVEQIGRAS